MLSFCNNSLRFFAEAPKNEAAAKELKKILEEFNKNSVDTTTRSLKIDYKKCNNCTHCAQICDKRVFGFSKLGDRIFLQTSTGEKLNKTNCNKCGQCAVFCPTGAITVRNDVGEVKSRLAKKDFKKSVIFFDSSVLSALKDILGKEYKAENIVAMLHKLGFDYVFNGDFGEDLFIIEESEELQKAADAKKTLISAHCPAFAEHYSRTNSSEVISTVKLPINCLTSVIKHEIDGAFVVSVSCCSAAKEVNESDFHLTTKEFAELIKEYKDMKETAPFDKPFDEASGAAAICGTNGGVTEAVMRTVMHLSKDDKQFEFNSLRNFEEPVRISRISGNTVCVTSSDFIGTDISKRIFNKDKQLQNVVYHETASCPGGCLNGGGNTLIQDTIALTARYSRVYRIDRSKNGKRCAHLNKTLKDLYAKIFDEEPGSKKALQLLHKKK